MQIIRGKYKGKKLKGFNIDGTRPTMSRIKESLFGIIQNKIPNSICLDLFAGSGSLGLEALSMGAKECYFVDNNSIVIKILQQNTNNISNTFILKQDYRQALKKLKSKKFDIIFLDSPYKNNLINPSLKLIKEYNILNKDGIIICEYEKEQIETDYKIIKEKKYNDKYIKILKQEN